MTDDASVEPRRTKFDIRREATLAELTRIGAEWFPTKGYNAVALRDVAKEAGVSTGAIYFHFKDKEDYFLRVMRAHEAQRGEWWLAATDPRNKTLREAIADSFQRMAAGRNDGGGTGGNWTRATLEFLLSVYQKPELQPTVKALYAQWVAELQQFYDLALTRDWIRTDISTQEITENILAMMRGFWVNNYFYGFSPDLAVDQIVRIVGP